MGINTTPDTVTEAGRFFLEPSQPRQRQYEALRAYFADGAPSAEVARRFGYQPGAFRVLCWRFRHQMDRDFFRPSPHGPTSQPRKDVVRSRVRTRHRSKQAFQRREA